MEQHFFIQKTSSYPMILGQPYVTSSRMETKVLEHGSSYARIQSINGKRSVQFLTVRQEHDRNKQELRINSCGHDMSSYQSNFYIGSLIGRDKIVQSFRFLAKIFSD